MAGNFSKDSFSAAVGGFSVGPYPSTGGGGGGGFRYGGKRRNKTEELFKRLETTLHEVLHPPIGTENAAQMRVEPAVRKAVKRLEKASRGDVELEARIARIQASIAAYEQGQEDDDEFMLMH